MDWHWLTIFGTWVYHHKTMCCVHSRSRFYVDLWPQIYRLLSCLHVWPLTSVSFDIGIPYLAHGSITMRGCVKYIHDLDTTMTFDWPQGQIYRVYDMALHSGLSFFVLWHSHTLFGIWVYHHGTMCRVHSWTLFDLDLWPQYQNYIFTMNLTRCLCSLT